MSIMLCLVRYTSYMTWVQPDLVSTQKSRRLTDEDNSNSSFLPHNHASGLSVRRCVLQCSGSARGGFCSHEDTGEVAFNLTYQWNDIIDPNLKYASDKAKAGWAYEHFAPKDYIVRIRWYDRSVMNSSGIWTSGWMASPTTGTTSGSRNQRGSR